MVDANERAENAAETVEGTEWIDRDAWKISWDVSQISFLDCFLFPRSRVSRIVVKVGYSFHGPKKNGRKTKLHRARRHSPPLHRTPSLHPSGHETDPLSSTSLSQGLLSEKISASSIRASC